MGSLPDELSLDLRSCFVPKTIADFLKEVSTIGNVSEKVSRVDGLVKRLEGEMRKIDGLKRELPVCMLLLEDAIRVLKDEAKEGTTRNSVPVLEEFIPLKKRNRNEEETDDYDDDIKSTKEEKEIKDKKNRMSSSQLLNTKDYLSGLVNHRVPQPKPNYEVQTQKNVEESCKNISGSSVFTPFKGYSDFLVRKDKEEEEISHVQGLSLMTPGMSNLKEESGLGFRSESRSFKAREIPISTPSYISNCRSAPQPPLHMQASRKQRRCWSPDLHRRFLNALQQLGGSQVATPKQIRELMQVEGLTNDEVKSHLQKHRLNNRKHKPDNSNLCLEKQSVVVLGANLWTPQETSGNVSKGSGSQSRSPEGPLELAAATADEIMEDGDEEDDKSESFSWKGHARKPRNDKL